MKSLKFFGSIVTGLMLINMASGQGKWSAELGRNINLATQNLGYR